MKKIFCLLMTIILALCGCSCGLAGQKNIEVKKFGYTCKADIKFSEDISAVVTLDVTGGGIFSVLINEPKDLSGIKFSFDNNNLTVSYGDMVSGKFSEFGDLKGSIELLNKIFGSLSIKDISAEYNGKNYVYEDKIDSLKYVVQFNEMRFPLTISVPEVDFFATLKDWQY